MSLLARVQLIEAYEAQTARLRAQQKALGARMKLEATRINSQLIAEGAIHSTLRAHGVGERVIAECGFQPIDKGVVVQFRAGRGQYKRQDNPHQPFATVLPNQSAGARTRAKELADGVVVDVANNPKGV